MDLWKQLPKKDILQTQNQPWFKDYPHVNGHLHTPYSFSAFSSVEQALIMAEKENVKVVGVNDFYSVNAYESWAKEAVKRNILPLFNIEFVGLSQEEQKAGIKINDPNNPGRIYMSGKGLSFPSSLPEPYKSQLANVAKNANIQVKEMCTALNAHLNSVGCDINFNFSELKEKYTKGIVRERHLAKALREEVYQRFENNKQRKNTLERIFNHQEVKSNLSDDTAIENEIRSKLLKSGGPAFIEENPDQFLSLESIRELIIAAGGIPTYPLLADSVNGGYTEFESAKEMLLETLIDKKIYAIEFIPNRNSMSSLEEYAEYFSSKGFIVTMGSEHNTPELLPIRLSDKMGNNLSDSLKRINFEGAAMTAAHQYLTSNGDQGFLSTDGCAIPEKREELIKLGSALIHYFNTSANEIIKL